MNLNDPKLIEILKGGGTAVLPTDTIYGLVANALNERAVERVYTLRQRNPEKPCIVLISNIEDLKKFSINLSIKQQEKISEYWNTTSRPTSIVLECPEEKFAYLHRGTKTLAFRLPNKLELRELLSKTGPLIAPSANPEGLDPAKNIEEAQGYFDTKVDLYIDAGEFSGEPSKVIKLHKDGEVHIIRE